MKITENPLLAEWTAPFGVPPFDLIKEDDYLPALRQGIAEQQAEIDAITDLPEPANFKNTIEALERSGGVLEKVASVFDAVNSANSNDIIRAAAMEIAPEQATHSINILLNQKLFSRIRSVYSDRDALGLDPEQMRLLEETYKYFVREGAELDVQAKQRLREINSQLATLAEQFSQNLLAETNAFELLVTARADLGNLPESLVALAGEEAKRRGHDCDCWVFTLQRPSINPFLEYSPNRELRREIFQGYAMRGDNANGADNNKIVTQMVSLRSERAQLLGFRTHADYVLSDQMAETPARVYELLDNIWTPALQAAETERDALQVMMKSEGIDAELAGWDWRYYTEKLRKKNYDFDHDVLRPYFEYTAVRDGAFKLAQKLFGLRFERRNDLPVWHEDQQVFAVFDADGSHLAVLYMDFFIRASKIGGAWMNSLRAQSRLDGDVRPIVTNNFNFPPPSGGAPALLSFREAETVFHEFGHALHGMLSDVTYRSLSGTRTPRDFVEFPSQVLENWMREPEVLRLFAKHYATGEGIPDEIIEKITASERFNKGFETVEYMAAAYLDMAYHTQTVTIGVNTHSFEAAAMEKIRLINEIIPRYRSAYFAHIFSGGYSAGYYSYLWSEVLDADAFQAFKETSLFDQETARKYRRHILSKGNTRPGMELYKAFRGRLPTIEPLLEKRGFVESMR
ncbi:MAG TPA: M3 family metallopeptidase [Gammaproteobacteria bacterium]|nr:M3 family metallopeptidase [Gammaproteobacteria bacterium]